MYEAFMRHNEASMFYADFNHIMHQHERKKKKTQNYISIFLYTRSLTSGPDIANET